MSSGYLSPAQINDGYNYFDLASDQQVAILKTAIRKYLSDNPQWYKAWLSGIPSETHADAKEFVVNIIASKMTRIWVDAISKSRQKRKLNEPEKDCDCGEPLTLCCLSCEIKKAKVYFHRCALLIS